MKILFATDGSDSALAALDFLLRFPLPADSEVLVTTVIDQAAFPDGLQGMLAGVSANGDLGQASSAPFPTATVAQVEDARRAGEDPDDRTETNGEAEGLVRREAQTHLALVSKRLQAAGWTSSSEIRQGHPIDQICASAEAWGADLIVVGTHGLTSFRQQVLGSVSAGLLHYAGCSVMIVPHPDLAERPPASPEAPRTQNTPLRFLLAHDGSEPADKALELCASLPLQGRASVTLLRVLELVTLYRQDLRQQLSRAFQEEKRVAQQELDAGAERLRQTTSDVDVKLMESGDLRGTILETATEQQCDLIVLGYKGRSAIKRMLVGSVISRIAAHTPCALLTVRS
ncbi:universal stress protein [Halochromatium sp.]